MSDEQRPIFSLRLDRNKQEEEVMFSLLDGWKQAYKLENESGSYFKAFLVSLMKSWPYYPKSIKETHKTLQKYTDFSTGKLLVSTSDIAEIRGISQRTVERHLLRLEGCGLVYWERRLAIYVFPTRKSCEAMLKHGKNFAPDLY